jgi:hypothetical protein
MEFEGDKIRHEGKFHHAGKSVDSKGASCVNKGQPIVKISEEAGIPESNAGLVLASLIE